MAQKYIDAVFKGAKGVRGNHMLVLLALADYAEESGRCRPSLQDLAHRVRLTGRTVDLIVRDLVLQGLISRSVDATLSSSSHSVIYQIDLDALAAEQDASA